MRKIIFSCLLLSLFACAATTEDCVVEQCRADSLSEEWCQAKIPQICHASEDFSRPEHDLVQRWLDACEDHDGAALCNN